MIGLIIVGLTIGIAIYWQILENRIWNRLIEDVEKQARGKQREYIFVEEETEEDTAFGVPIDMLEEEN